MIKINNDPIGEEIIKGILKAREDHIKELERQIEAMKEWIIQQTGVEITNRHLGIDEQEEKLIDGIPLTKQEMERLEHSSIILEQHANMFNYGRSVREEKMAESL